MSVGVLTIGERSWKGTITLIAALFVGVLALAALWRTALLQIVLRVPAIGWFAALLFGVSAVDLTVRPWSASSGKTAATVGLTIVTLAVAASLAYRVRRGMHRIVALTLAAIAGFALVILAEHLGRYNAVVLITTLLATVASASTELRREVAVVAASLLVTIAMPIFLRPWRLAAFARPSADPLGHGFERSQLLIGIGAGGLSGRGYGEGIVTKYGFLPNTRWHTFAVAAEEGGFVIVVLVLALSWIVLLRCWLRATATAAGPRRFVAACGATYLTLRFTIALPVSIGLLPSGTVTVPFLGPPGVLVVDWYVLGVIVRATRSTARADPLLSAVAAAATWLRRSTMGAADYLARLRETRGFRIFEVIAIVVGLLIAIWGLVVSIR